LKLLKILLDSPEFCDSNGAEINSIGQELRALGQFWEKQPNKEHLGQSKFAKTEYSNG
jgi:hypothetical protein